MKKSISLILFLFLFSPLACDDSSNSNNGNNVTTNEEFLTLLQSEYVDGYCAYLDRCPQADGEEWMTSEAACRVVMGEMLIAEGLQEMKWALENGAEYSVDNLNTCMSALNGASCDTNLDSVAACDRVLEGTLATDAECSSNWQCASGFCNTAETCPGFCEPTVGVGQPCDDSDQCNSGLECNWDTDSPVCATPAAKAAQGDECEWHDDCEYGLFCLITDFETYVGVCQPWLGEGDVCDGDGNMDVVCEPGLACDYVSGECAPVTVVGVGETCDNETIICSFADRAYCMEGQSMGTCVQIPGNGDACMDGYCWTGNYCGDDNLCHTALANGQPCTNSDQCLSEMCNGTTCDYEPCGNELIDNAK
ncbi:hypothetical protein KKD52_01630 [Myxococcota bacterium]|nr:hypothetical protein [Myxococcota bacterium]MBU1412743.1 hypothetical protein [Myxococcota bacterium]MBU1509033.1 hypothetical protein [Myxococcota bacterium]